ncbi:hypothetical protein SPHINGO8AM_180043 [Sphingomonas sp. 8AM]|nr:hypothetical protein SPHINGO8AM_180043 [Sphingomonas sp. 8AM]
MAEDVFQHVRVVIDAELVGDGQQQRIGLGYALVGAELLDQPLGLGGVGAAEHRAHIVDHTDLVAAAVAPEIGAVAVVGQREDRARYRDARGAGVPRRLPRLAIGADLFGLLDVERLAAFVGLQGRALQVHPHLRRPDRGGVRRRAPPDPLAQPLGVRFEAEQARRVGEHRLRTGPGEALALQQPQEQFAVAATHIGVALAGGGGVAEIAPALDHLLGRAAADPELQAAARDQVRRAGILGHVEGVFVAHVDDAGADLDRARLRADRGEQRERRGELLREMVDAVIGAVRAEFLGGDREVDRLEEHVARRAGGGAVCVGPVAEGEEADLFHGFSPDGWSSLRAERSTPESDQDALDCFAPLAMTKGLRRDLLVEAAAGFLDVRHVLDRPAVQRLERLVERAPQRRDGILDRDRRRRDHAARDHAVALQAAQALRQRLLRHALQMTADRVEAHRTGIEHGEHHHRPFVGDLVEQRAARAVDVKVLTGADGFHEYT